MISRDADTTVLAIIPARGGSKGLPGKNMRPLCGKPLISWTIEAARSARLMVRLIVSTDDEGIAATAKEHGAEVPFMRPAELALDATPGISPVLHCLEWLREHEGYRPEIVLVLQPTSPLREPCDIDGAIDFMTQGGWEFVISVARVTKPPVWIKHMDADGRLSPFFGGAQMDVPRQAHADLYIPNGAIYAARTESLLHAESFYTDETRGYLMSSDRSIDIDDSLDFTVAECLLRARFGEALV